MPSSPCQNDQLVICQCRPTDAAEPAEWRIDREQSLRIGRSSENDICIRDAHVSRSQAVIFFEEGRWQCSSFGRATMFVDGGETKHCELHNGVALQWTRSGPEFEVETECNTSAMRSFVDTEPVSIWLEQLREGDSDAAGQLWEKYFERIVHLARNRLGHTPRRAVDEEDVALSVFNSLFEGVNAGRFPELASRDSLWRLLVVMTARKAIDQIHHQRRQKRGGGMVRGESVLQTPGMEGSFSPGFGGIMGDTPTPEFAAALEEETDLLLKCLDSDELRAIALLKLQGYTNEEIATERACTIRTVERKLRTIRDIWTSEIDSVD